MKRYLGPLLGVLSVAACSTQKPAVVPDETTRNDAAHPMAVTGDMTPASDGTLEPMNTGAATDGATRHATHSGDAKPVTSASDTPPATTDSKTLDASVAPDNTRLNKRDAKGTALTPLDQGEGQSDLDITKRIRQAVVGDGSLSFNAKNVKIITREGKVTLRGPVSTSAERSAIQAAAQKVAGAGNVDNQLEVKK